MKEKAVPIASASGWRRCTVSLDATQVPRTACFYSYFFFCRTATLC